MSFGVASAVIGSAVIGGVVASKGASKAAKAQRDAANQASQTELEMFYQNRDDLQPWRDAGGASLGELEHLLGISGGARPAVEDQVAIRNRLKDEYDQSGKKWTTDTLNAAVIKEQQAQQRALSAYTANQRTQASRDPTFGSLNRSFSLADFQKDPGYQFRMDEGMRGVESSAAARGGALGGRALKELTRYGQGYASNEYGNAYNRFNNDQTQRFNRLSSLAGTGQTATTQTAQMGQQTASNVAGNQMAVGNARASGYVGQANAISGGLNTLGSLYGMGAFGGSTPNVTTGSNPYGYNGTMNNPSAYIG